MGVSYCNSTSKIISAKKKKEPCFLLMSMVFFPIHPKPLFFAQALSKIGAESVKTRALISPISSNNSCKKVFSLSFIIK